MPVVVVRAELGFWVEGDESGFSPMNRVRRHLNDLPQRDNIDLIGWSTTGPSPWDIDDTMTDKEHAEQVYGS